MSWVQFKARSLAGEEAAKGVVDIYTFEAARVWSCVTCSGPPCCPATWLIETADGEYIEICSWQFLIEAKGRFPGQHVSVTCWPKSGRVLNAVATGEPLAREVLEGELAWNFGGGNERFRIVPQSEIPAGLQNLGGG